MPRPKSRAAAHLGTNRYRPEAEDRKEDDKLEGSQEEYAPDAVSFKSLQAGEKGAGTVRAGSG